MSRSQPSKTFPKPTATTDASQGSQRPNTPLVRSILIEPRDNEPPRVSVSVEYESEAPNLKALKKVAMEVCHDVVRRASAEGTLKDLGYRESQTKKTLTQTFSL